MDWRLKIDDCRLMSRTNGRALPARQSPIVNYLRRGSILVLVMTILGLLFVTGVAFMATMNFEAQRMRYETQRSDANPAVGRMMLTVDEVMSDAMTPPPGFSFTDFVLGSTTTYAELPGVHNLFSPIEPYRDANWVYYWPWATDILALRPASGAKFIGSDATMTQRSHPNPIILYRRHLPPIQSRWQPGKPIPSTPPWNVNADADGDGVVDAYDLDADGDLVSDGYLDVDGDGIIDSSDLDGDGIIDGYDLDPNGYGFRDGYPVDADGDGISDSYAVRLSAVPGMDDKQIDELKRVLNPQSDPDGDLWMGLRVIAHGGLVNLTYSHPRLIENVMETGTSAFQLTLQEVLDQGHWPYSPAMEEPQLRRRNFLPPHFTPPGGLLGNTLIKQPDIFAGGGDYPAQLLPFLTQSLGDSRYWPFGFNESGNHPGSPGDPDFTTWSIFMDPEYSTSVPLFKTYDRRHLVTSISHEANIRRPVAVIQQDPPATATFGNDEILNLMHARNIAACPVAPGTLLPFELANYPFGLRNEARIVNDGVLNNTATDYRDYCSCMTDVDANGERVCTLNPRKGQLKLSLPELDTITDIPLRNRLIYDAFIMMVLNMREENTAWGSYQTNPPYEWRWTAAGLAEVSKLAASLTANLIDYADTDDLPTGVDIRSLDFSTPGTVGNPTGSFVYGIERQPFITEVVAQVVAVPVPPPVPPPAQFYGIEIFNPSTTDINLSDYKIVTDLESITLDGILSGGQFIAYQNDILPPAAKVTGQPVLEPLLSFTDVSTIKLVRTIPGGAGFIDVTVDQFEVTGDLGLAGAGFISHQRSAQTFSSRRWTAPIPRVYELGTPTFGAGSDSVDYDATLSQVYLENADAGSLADSFPTTGMMLMLMRHANRSYTPGGTNEAFTASLNLSSELSGANHPPAGRLPVDNGRMPVFDPFIKHRHDPANPLALNRPGDFAHLPWGQFVFDYFMTMPLNSPGPYTEAGGTVTISDVAPPKVDMDGLRVHGRININAAPWKVLEGLPLIPMNSIPAAQLQMRQAFEGALLPVPSPPPNTVTTIGPDRAKAIVAYREMREYFDPMNPNVTMTGNYDTERSWSVSPPNMQFRRGTGYMTVGELANVRHPAANPAFPASRLDSFELTRDTPDYLSAIAFLACLQDWATVRSDTFTVYGTLRGTEAADDFMLDDKGNPDQDKKIKDVDSRALRFQETISRVPMFLQAPPSRIGDRVIARYIDARGD